MAGDMSDFSREATDLTRDGETQLPLQADMSIEEGQFYISS